MRDLREYSKIVDILFSMLQMRDLREYSYFIYHVADA